MIFFSNNTQINRPTRIATRGFTLIELVVVISIIGIISAIAIPSFKSYNSDVLLTNSAYALALAVRQTQFYGIAVKQIGNNANSGSYSDAYGIHFDSQKNSYLIYQDIPDSTKITSDDQSGLSYYYTGTDATSPEFISTTPLDTGYSFQKICMVQTVNAASTQSCSSSGTDAFIDIEFARPNPDAIITSNISGTNVTYKPDGTFGKYGACIYITSGTIGKNVYVDETGQISVDSTACQAS